eukprot:scaffold29768_cov74-Phaeocystis_antarctica.AAC.2
MMALPLEFSTVRFEPLRCAPLRSSSSPGSPSMVRLHATGQLLSPAGRCLSISTVHGGAGEGGGLGEDESGFGCEGGDDGGVDIDGTGCALSASFSESAQ